MDQKQYLNVFKKFIKGMIDKDASLLIESMSKDASLYHMTGYKVPFNISLIYSSLVSL